MSDWGEVKEQKPEETTPQDVSEPLSPRGISAIQGDDTAPEPVDVPQESPSDEKWITVRSPLNGPETLPSPETEGTSLQAGEGRISGTESETPQPPEGWHPGGVEGGG